MKEQLISFKTAKLAKEKGFDEYCDYIYKKDKDVRKCCYYEGENDDFDEGYNKNSELPFFENDLITAPTQSLLQKWLRETHKIHLSIDNNNYEKLGNWCFDIHNLPKTIKYLWTRGDKTYSSYEEALEKGLQETLKLI